MKKNASLYLEAIISISIFTIIFIPLLNSLMTFFTRRVSSTDSEYTSSSFSEINSLINRGYSSLSSDTTLQLQSYYLEDFMNTNWEKQRVLLIKYKEKDVILTPLVENYQCGNL